MLESENGNSIVKDYHKFGGCNNQIIIPEGEIEGENWGAAGPETLTRNLSRGDNNWLLHPTNLWWSFYSIGFEIRQKLFYTKLALKRYISGYKVQTFKNLWIETIFRS